MYLRKIYQVNNITFHLKELGNMKEKWKAKPIEGSK